MKVYALLYKDSYIAVSPEPFLKKGKSFHWPDLGRRYYVELKVNPTVYDFLCDHYPLKNRQPVEIEL